MIVHDVSLYGGLHKWRFSIDIPENYYQSMITAFTWLPVYMCAPQILGEGHESLKNQISWEIVVH